jgi:hypothetical protein
MRSFANPFRSRASEQQRDQRSFLRTFGPGAIDMLPDTLWDRLVVLRSAPGGGKTSLMRLFTTDSLMLFQDRLEFDDLGKKLEEVGGLDESEPAILGVLLNMERDYRALADVAGVQNAARLFFRLLGARIMVAVIRSALALRGRIFPDDASSFSLVIREDASDNLANEALQRLGGPVGDQILASCRETERAILAMLDSLMPIRFGEADVGHGDLYSLHLLSKAQLLVDGESVSQRLLIMFDDGNRLAREQRDALLQRLVERSLNVARWYAERYEALSPNEILAQLGTPGRDFELVELESVARGSSVDAQKHRFWPGRFERVLVDIANRRASVALARYADEDDSFFQLLEFDDEDYLNDIEADVADVLRQRIEAGVGRNSRYRAWLEEARKLRGYQAALRYRELEILIARDSERKQRELFEFELRDADAQKMSNSAIREAAAVALANEFGIPYYAGTDLIPKLGSHNVEQFLFLCGDIFTDMLASITLQRKPRVSAWRQDRIVRRASEEFWRDIPRRVPHGREIQTFLNSVVEMARLENQKPRLPYPPGVTGTALSMSDRTRLLNDELRERIPGGNRLLQALSEGIGRNLIGAELDRSVKGGTYLVMYINRLLCPRFGLPLGRGGFREKRLEAMSEWMLGPSRPYVQQEHVIKEKLPI